MMIKGYNLEYLSMKVIAWLCYMHIASCAAVAEVYMHSLFIVAASQNF